jgi:hypothetical protein
MCKSALQTADRAFLCHSQILLGVIFDVITPFPSLWRDRKNTCRPVLICRTKRKEVSKLINRNYI